MASRTNLHRRTREDALNARREDWLRVAVLSGFMATFAMTVVLAIAYGLSHAIGVEQGNLIERWFWALAHNPITQATADAIALAIGLNLLMGIIWALVYGRFFEPALDGPAWRKGMIFALLPWLLSIVAFLPIAGGGFLGLAIGAGPLPIVGNLILHLIYGATLGAVYSIALEAGLEDPTGERAAAAAAERGAAIGIGVGVVAGAVAGWLIGPGLEEIAGRGTITLAGALTGAAIGILIGSLLGMGEDPKRSTRSHDRSPDDRGPLPYEHRGQAEQPAPR